MTKSMKLDEGAAVLLGAAAFKDILSRDPDACILGAIVSQQSETVEGEPEQMRRIGVLMNAAADDLQGQAGVAAFQQFLQQLGWSDGRNVRIDTRWGVATPSAE